MKLTIEKEMTLDEAADYLRDMAKLCAENTRNWDAFQDICYGVIKGAYNHGREKAERTLKRPEEISKAGDPGHPDNEMGM